MAAPMAGSVEERSPKTKTKTPKKKRKLVDDSGDVGEDVVAPKKKVARPDFTEIEFKVGLKDPSTRFAVLERFVEEAANFPGSTDYDIVAAYCRSSGECIEVLNLLEGEKRKPKELCAILEALETILVAVAGRLPVLSSVGQAVAKRILSAHVGSIFYLLQAQNKTQHLKVALRLLSSLVVQGDTAPRDVMRQVDLAHSAFPTLLKRTDIKDPMDVRATTIHFMLSFLVVGDKDAVIQILETKGFLNNIFPGLYADKLNVLEMVLPTIREKVVRNPDVSKTLKVRLCNQHTLMSLAKLYQWTGPRRWKKGHGEEGAGEEEQGGASREDRDAVVDLVHKLLLDLCCDFKLGINFYDKTYGTAGKSLNHVLTAFLKSLSEPYTSPHLTELVIGVLKACPDQLVWYLPDLRTAVTPRVSNKWLAAMRLLHQVYTSQPPVAPCMSLHDRTTVHKLVNMSTASIIPPREVWSLLLTAIRHKSPVVQKEGLGFLLVVLRRIKATLDFCQRENPLYTQGEMDAFCAAFKDAMIKTCPDMATLLGCWSRAVKSVGSETNGVPQDEEDESDGDPDVDDLITKGIPAVSPADLLLSVLRALTDYQAAFPDVFAENLVNFSVLLEGVRRVAGDDDTSSHQEALLQLHLLRLLAESDLRQITWLKESVSGRSTLYLLLEMTVVTRTNPKMAAIATSLLQKLLVSTGLFPHVAGELAVWIGHLVEAAAQEHDVLPFVERVFSAVLKDPFTYSEKVANSVTEAVTMETADGQDTAGSATTTSDHLIDSILSMDDVDMEGDSLATCDKGAVATVDADSDLSLRFPFSVLVPAALKLWKEDKEGKGDSEMKDISAYLGGVIHSVLHTQTDPAPLCLMLQQEDALHLDPSVTRLLPGSKKVKSTKSKTDLSDPTMPLPDLLTATFSGGAEVLLTTDCESRLREACCGVTLGESEVVVRQLLLYTRTYGLTALKDSQSPAVVELYLSLISEILGSVGKDLEEDMTTETEDKDTTIDPMGDETDPVGNLQVPEPTREVVLSRLVTLVAAHPDLQAWFLWERGLSTRGKAAKLGAKLRPVITTKVSAILSSVPQELCASLEPVLGKYTQKTASQFMSYINGLRSADVSVNDASDVTDAMLALGGLLSWRDVIMAVQGLAKLPIKMLVRKQSLTTLGQLLLSLLTTVVSTLQSTPTRLTDLSAGLSLHTMSRLCTLSTSADLPDLDRVLCDLVDLCPLYALGSDQDHFTRCVQAPPGGAAHKMAVSVVAHSEAGRRWFQQYWSGLSNKRRTSKKWDVVDIVGAYVRGLVAAKGQTGQEQITRIHESYWADLCAWVVGDEETGDAATGDADQLDLLTLLTEATTDTESLETCWRSLLSHVVSVNRLSIGRARYLYTLSQCLSRCTAKAGDQDPLPVWEVWVGAALSTLVNLLSTVKIKKQNAEVIGELLRQLTDVLQTQRDVSTLGEVVRPVWGQIVKAGLRHLFRDPGLLRVLAGLVGVVYSCQSDVIPVTDLYEMILSHSQFLPTMLQETPTAAKDALVELLLKVVQHIPPSACKSSHVTALLGAYGATLSATDQRLLLLLSLFESRGCSMDEHKPFLWGPKAVEHHSVRHSLGTSLWRRATSERVMEALSPETLGKSCLNFPLQRKLAPTDVVPAEALVASDIYDPCFLLPLFSHVLAPGHIVNCFEFVEKGCLGYVLTALSCHDEGLRGAAYHVLAEFSRHVDETRFPAKDQVQYLLQVVRQSVTAPNNKLACMVTTFLTRAAKLMVTPDAPLYSAVNEFLLLKPAMDVQNVPEFYKLFNSASLEYKTDRAWMLSLLADGLRETADYRLMERRYTLKLVLSFHDSSLSDAFTRGQVLKVVLRAVGQRTVSAELVKQHGLLAWINAAISNSSSDVDRHLLVDIMDTLWRTMLAARQARAERGQDGDQSVDKDQSQTEIKEEEGVRDSRRHLLPLAFTNEMLHIVLHLLNVMSRHDHDDPSVFRQLVGCLSSILTHLRTTVAAMDTLPPLCVKVKVTDVLHLLHLWNSLRREEQAKLEVRGLLSVLGQNVTDAVVETTQKKTTKHSRKVEEPVDKVGSQKEADLCVTSIHHIVKVITHWVPQAGSRDRTEGSHDPGEVAAILYVSAWSLDHVHRYFSHDLDLLCDVLQWLRSWVCDVTALRTVMTSETGQVRLFVGELLLTLGLCTKSLCLIQSPEPSSKCPSPTDSASQSPTKSPCPATPYALTSCLHQAHSARTLTTEVLTAVVDHVAADGRQFSQTRLGQVLSRPPFKTALSSLPEAEKGALCLLIQELWMNANTPLHFTTAVSNKVKSE